VEGITGSSLARKLKRGTWSGSSSRTRSFKFACNDHIAPRRGDGNYRNVSTRGVHNGLFSGSWRWNPLTLKQTKDLVFGKKKFVNVFLKKKKTLSNN
jgi:hypothetical protein